MESKTVKELQDLCKKNGLKGYSGKKKAELVALLRAVLATPPAAALPPVKIPVKPVPKPPAPPPLTLPQLSMFGFSSQAEEVFKWIQAPPSIAVLYGPSGIGKSLFASQFFSALGYSVIEIDSGDDEILFQPSVDGHRVALMDDVEKFPKLGTKKPLLTHLFVIMRDKPTAVGDALVLKVNRHSTPALVRWLASKYPQMPEQDLRELCEKNNGDIRHILITLSSAFPGADVKDEILEKDAWSAVGTIYSGTGSFARRMEHALIDLDMVLCLTADGLPKSGATLETLVDTYENLSYTDVMRHQDGRAAGVVCVIGKLKQAQPELRSPFVPFPAWYGKYSKTEKQKKWLADWRRRAQMDFETLGLWRASLLHRVGELSLDGLSEKEAVSVCAKFVLKEMWKARLDYDDVFEKYPEMLLEGTEIEELDERVVKEVRLRSTAAQAATSRATSL